MAVSSSSAIIHSEEDFSCPICWNVFHTPVIVSQCKHIFCRKCFLVAMKTTGPYCPACRGPVGRQETTKPIKAIDKQKEMNNHIGQCKGCGKLKQYSIMRRHQKMCKKYKEDYS